MPASRLAEPRAHEFRYEPLTHNRAHLEVIAQWFFQQWRVPPAETIHELSVTSTDLPTPVAALRREEVVGILTFKVYPVDAVSDAALWVNSLYVREDCRGCGVGSQLLLRGMAQANRGGTKRLFVYTDIPGYYAAHGWREFKPKNPDGMSVLEYQWS